MDINPIVLSIPLYFILIVLELFYQTIRHKKLYRTADAISNISCGITSQISNALWGVASIGMYQYVYEYWSISNITNTWWSYIVLFLLVDFCYYWFHRASHEVNFLWNTSHVVHHQSEDYNLSVALRQASFGSIFSILFYLPLALIGFNTYAFIAVKGINLIYQFWIHTEVIRKLPPWFEFVFNTPSHHRVHHGRNPKYIDRNHAGTFMIWDRLFGTFQAEEEAPTYGITKPIKTWNPLSANVYPIYNMVRQVHKSSGFLNKVKVVFYKPGWQPAEMGGYQAPPTIASVGVEKFDVHPPTRFLNYLFIQFVLILGLTAVFLFTHNSYGLYIKLLVSGYIVWTVAQLGLLMENKKRWVPFEYIRVITSGTIVFFFFRGLLPAIVTILSISLFILWLYRIEKR